MKKFRKKGKNLIRLPMGILALVIAGMVFCTGTLGAVRLKDLSYVKGVRDNSLVGFGIVVGLNGTGDSKETKYTAKAIASMLTKMGIFTKKEDVQIKNTAAVMVTAMLNPFAQNGDRVDLTLSSVGDAKSLAGGMLLKTPLLASDQNVYIVGQGMVSVGGLGADQTTTHLTVARVPQGGIVERDNNSKMVYDGIIELVLKEPDFSTASRIEKDVNMELGGLYAEALNRKKIKIKIPNYYRGRLVRFISILENIETTADQRAVIVINERTGTIVMGANVRISTVAISHGSLSVEVKDLVAEELGKAKALEAAAQESKAGKGKKKSEAPEPEVDAKMIEQRLNIVKKGADIGSVVKGLNALGVKPRDLIQILQAVKAAGALDAELKFI